MAAASYQSLFRLDCAENSETVLQSTFYTDRDWTTPAMATTGLYPLPMLNGIALEAAGGVGLIACQWANALGATVIGTVGSEEKAEIASKHGCHHTINYQQEDVAELFDMVGSGKVNIPIHQRYALDDVQQAHRDLEARKTTGTTLLIPA